MAVKAVQQIMLGSVMNSEEQAKATLSFMKESGYQGIELCNFMIQPAGFLVKMLTKAAGMPIGKGNRLNWNRLIEESGIEVVSLHSDLGSLEKDPNRIIETANSFKTDNIVITGMYRFDYSNKNSIETLAKRLNQVGETLAVQGKQLLYHNHNCELRKISQNETAYDFLIKNTESKLVNFEFDSYWFQEAGADALYWMKVLGERMKLWHINDRGNRMKGSSITPIMKSDSMELGTGNMNLEELLTQALINGVESIVLESHRNWIDRSPLKSLELSGTWLKDRV